MRPGRGLLVYPCFKPFHVAILKRSNVAVGISTKATDREDICLQTVFLVFHQTLVLSISRILHTPHFAYPAFSMPHVSHTPCFPHTGPCTSGLQPPRFPCRRNGHDFAGGFAQIAPEKKDFYYFINGRYKLT